MGKKVVFVDDSKTVLMSAKMIVKPLVDSGVVELFEFENPLDFLEKVKNEGFVYDLVITDVNMPQMNGLDMAKELKSIPELKLKPILALTTENSPEKKQLAKEIGLAGWITKPFSPEKLLMGIKRVLKIR
jgi:two-component system chemotaxis response regulator CheY